MPIAILKRLPKKARQIWESTYNSAKAKHGPERASKIAWGAVKNKYKKEGNKWVLKGRSVLFKSEITINSQKLVCRSEGIGDTSRDYLIEGYVATPNLVEEDGMIYTPKFLRSLEKQIREFPITVKGDIEHINHRLESGRKVKEEIPTMEDIMNIVDTKVDENGLWIRAKLDKYVENFPMIWERLKNRFYDAFSIEVYLDERKARLVNVGNGYVREVNEGRIKSFTLTGRPADKFAKITSVYTS